MAGINFLSENYADSATQVLTTGTENSQFPLTNIQIESTAKKFRSNENSIAIRFDLQQTRDIDAFAITGDATQNLGLTVASIKISLTTDFSGSTAIPITLSAEHNIGYEFFTTETGRYVELTLTGTGSFVEVSNLFIGEKIELTQNNLSIGSFRYENRDRSTISRNKYAQKFIDTRNKVKVINGRIEFATKTEHELLDDMFIRHGRSLPLWMIVDKDGNSFNESEYKLTMYGYIDRTPQWSANGGQHYSANIRMEQAI